MIVKRVLWDDTDYGVAYQTASPLWAVAYEVDSALEREFSLREGFVAANPDKVRWPSP